MTTNSNISNVANEESDWEVISDPNHNTFWRHRKTGKSQYETPVAMLGTKEDLTMRLNKMQQRFNQYQSGIVKVTKSGDFTVHFDHPYETEPIVMLTGNGIRDHATACLKSAPTKSSFQARLIHYDGSWETGVVHWFATPSTSTPAIV